tara:strand:- start:909 stop:1646 length:738 start_codon:yes stop_codon:yes gene_type:complete
MWKKKLYINDNLTPFSISRSKIDLYFDCQRCFYLDQKHGIRRPHGTPLVINNFVVKHFKNILEDFRKKQIFFPESSKINRKLIPSNNKLLENWTHPFKGVSYIDKKTNLKIKGNLDDVWVCENTGESFPVIIKSTSRKKDIHSSNIWPGYWKQLSLYSYLLARNSITTGSFGILLYLNASENLPRKLKKIDFELLIFEKKLDCTWIEPTFDKIYKMLNSMKVPLNSYSCKYCNYQTNIQKVLDGK